MPFKRSRGWVEPEPEKDELNVVDLNEEKE